MGFFFIIFFFIIFDFFLLLFLASVTGKNVKRDLTGSRRGTPLERRHTVADSSTAFVEKSVKIPKQIPETPESTGSLPKMSGSEKKRILLEIVREELNKNGMGRKNGKIYKECIRKLHDMCRTLIKVTVLNFF